MSYLKIDLNTGVFVVKGGDDLVKNIYDDFKSNLKVVSGLVPVIKPSTTEPELKILGSKKEKKNKTTRKESYKFVKDLDLLNKGGESLKEFYSKKAPSSGFECTAVFVYYLQKTLNCTNIGVDHIYSCYKEVGRSVPGALKQSLYDSSSKKGWVDTTDITNITITTSGENLVEHNLPRQAKTKK